MTRFLAYVSMSLDGRIADADGGTGWLADHAGAPEEGDRGYAAFHAAADAVVMGRRTHDDLRGTGGPWPYRGKPCFVTTSRMLDPEGEDILPVLPDYAGLRDRLTEGGHDRVWVLGGAQTLSAAAAAGMLDELRLFILPVVLGEGRALFETGTPPGARLIGHRLWPGGVVELTYGLSAGDD
ncbi:dihydrofolate reductase family protein [Pseudoroseicyclus tamaricis]|uniref:Dihydrofolate reductase n=1 Tax=Pseudoroseicyclus tamaricis TaxID=2705421 RepID=A0A6B2JEW1_9RHOB|nr:dihydrofolate reductase family protein [Pseudoroseicyclus tamaricis]NDU99462.1 dihydrofolate reductase [Pseudoroseicyclus tamaricis]